jgi:hypothetical protein
MDATSTTLEVRKGRDESNVEIGIVFVDELLRMLNHEGTKVDHGTRICDLRQERRVLSDANDDGAKKGTLGCVHFVWLAEANIIVRVM